MKQSRIKQSCVEYKVLATRESFENTKKPIYLAIRLSAMAVFELFGIYERIRLDEGLLTFDDMLLGAWELLESFAEVRSQVQAMFDCALVDEFSGCQFGAI